MCSECGAEEMFGCFEAELSVSPSECGLRPIDFWFTKGSEANLYDTRTEMQPETHKDTRSAKCFPSITVNMFLRIRGIIKTAAFMEYYESFIREQIHPPTSTHTKHKNTHTH